MSLSGSPSGQTAETSHRVHLGMTVVQLREYASRHGVSLAGLSRKADIIERINGWPQTAPTPSFLNFFGLNPQPYALPTEGNERGPASPSNAEGKAITAGKPAQPSSRLDAPVFGGPSPVPLASSPSGQTAETSHRVHMGMTVVQLREYASRHGMSLAGLSRKADIIERINGWPQTAPTPSFLNFFGLNPQPYALPTEGLERGSTSPSYTKGKAGTPADTVQPSRRLESLAVGSSSSYAAEAPSDNVGLPRTPPSQGPTTLELPEIYITPKPPKDGISQPECSILKAPSTAPVFGEQPRTHASVASSETSRPVILAGGERRTRVYQRVQGHEVQQLRKTVKELVRDATLSRQQERIDRLANRQRNRDWITDQPLPPVAVIGRTKVDVDHTLECQLMAQAIVQCPELRSVLREVNLGSNSLSQQPVVVQNRLALVKQAHNGDPNLGVVSQATNLKKGGAVRAFLNRVDSGHLSEGLGFYLCSTFSEGNDDDVVGSLAAGSIVRELRTVEPYLVGQLRDPEVDAILRTQGVQDRRRVQTDLEHLADGLTDLFELIFL